MKLLIQNYTSSISSKPIYLDHAIRSSACGESFLWNMGSISAYDVMDGFQPDAVLVHASGLNRDIVKYVTSQKSTPLVVDITGATQEAVRNLETQFYNLNVPVKCFLSESVKCLNTVKTERYKLFHLPPGFDVFLGKDASVPKFNLDGCVIGRIDSHSTRESVKGFETYHKILVRDSNGLGNRENFDIEANVMFLTSLYGRYGETILNGDLKYIFSQLFFDSTMSSTKVSLNYPFEQKADFMEVLKCLFEDTGSEPSIGYIKDQIKKSHTCVDRCSQLLSELGDSEAAKQVLKLKEAL